MILGPFGPGIADDTGKPLHCVKVGPIRRGAITRVMTKAIGQMLTIKQLVMAVLVHTLTLSDHLL